MDRVLSSVGVDMVARLNWRCSSHVCLYGQHRFDVSSIVVMLMPEANKGKLCAD